MGEVPGGENVISLVPGCDLVFEGDDRYMYCPTESSGVQLACRAFTEGIAISDERALKGHLSHLHDGVRQTISQEEEPLRRCCQ